jgi:predicted permease
MRFPGSSAQTRDRDAALDDELRTHLEMAVADRLAQGESRENAERAARREFGNVTQVAEVTREMRGWAGLERFQRDVRYALRGLARSPSFAVVAILTLALGIGANTAVFTVVHGVLLRPLPFREPSRLMLLSHLDPNSRYQVGIPALDEGTYQTVRREQKSFENLAFFNWSERTLTGAGDPARVHSGIVTADFMRVLGVNAEIGRTFAANEDTPANDKVAVLGQGLWKSRFGADSAAVGKPITLDGERFTIIGVMPAGFNFPREADVWTPILLGLSPTRVWIRPTVGRLREGVTAQAAVSELAQITAAMKLPNQRSVARVVPLADLLTSDVRKSLLIFAGAVACVLLIACANVANLLLLRANARRHEIGIRAALGASQGRLVRQMLTESVVVSVLGGAAGIVLSFLGVRVLLSIAPDGRIPRLSEIHVDTTVLAVSLGASLIAGLACGIVPALIATRRELRESIGDGARTFTGGHEPVRRMLVMAELALAIVLLSGAGLLVKSFAKIRAVDPGFASGNVYTLSVSLPQKGYKSVVAQRAFHSNVLGRLAALPGVDGVGAANWVPMTSMFVAGDFTIEHGPPMPRGFVVAKLASSPGYFRSLGIGVVHGRDFSPSDREGSVPVAIITKSVARQFWPPDGATALGKRITSADEPKAEDWLTIVGVVEDVVQSDLTKARMPALYQPMGQMENTYFLGDFTYVVHAHASAGIPEAMRAAIRKTDASLPVPPVATMEQLLSLKLAEPLFEARLLTTFSLLALILAAIGIYGVLASDVASRSHEIGLRMALGASRPSVVQMVLRRTAALVLPGLAIGVGGALLLTGILKKSLYGVTPTDPTTFIAVSALLGVVAFVAALIPARRATRIDPIRALRHE